MTTHPSSLVPIPLACPSPATLMMLGTDAIGDRTFEAIEQHVESCDRCRALLEQLVTEPASQFDAGDDRADAFPRIPGLEIERELGRGSSGVVYLAYEPAIDRHVALKVVPGGVVAGPKGRARWTNEARAVSRLRHPNVVRLYRVDETAEWLALVFEYIPGGTLKERINGPLDPTTAASVVETVALAVAYIHERGLLHLDIKPSNILLDGDPQQPLSALVPKVSDFGIARTAAEPSLSDTSLLGPRGTPSYMAPEQAVPGLGKIGQQTDVFALGVLLYHLLTGTTPFQAESVIETIDRIRHEEPIPPSQINNKVPKRLDQICMLCLRKQPAQRTAGPKALATELRAWIDRAPTKSKLDTDRHKGNLWRRRGGWVAALAVLLALSASIAVWNRSGKRSEPAPVSSINDLSRWIRQMLDNPRLLRDERLDEFMATTEKHTKTLINDRSIDADSLVSLAILERMLSSKLHIVQVPNSQTRGLVERAADLLTEASRRKPGDEDIVYELALTLLHATTNGEYYQETSAFFDRAIELAKGLKLPDRRCNIFALASDDRRLQANQFFCRDDPATAADLLNADLRMFAGMDPSDAARPSLLIRRQFSQALLSKRPIDIENIRALRKTDPSQFQTPTEKEDLTEYWINFTATLTVFPEQSLLVPQPGTEPGAVASALLARLRSDCAAAGVDERIIPKALMGRLTNPITSVSASYRRIAHQAGMDRLALRLLALGNEITGVYPDQPESYMILSEAYVQLTKNAWNRGQDSAAIDLLRRSRDAARRAESLSPSSLRAREMVEDRERRLAKSLGE